MNEESLRVLLVEDEKSVREPLAQFLCDWHSYRVDPAAYVEQALRFVQAAEQPYHVAVIDDLLAPGAGKAPIRSGIELMRQIKKLSPRTEIIIFTGQGMERAPDALRAGAFLYLPKTLNPDELAILIRQAAEQHNLVKERDTLKLLNVVSDKLNLSHLDLKNLLQEIITLTTVSLGADEGSLFVIGDDGVTHHWQTYGNSSLSGRNAGLILDRGCAGWVIRHGKSVRLDNYRTDPRWLALPDDLLQQGSALIVPLKQE